MRFGPCVVGGWPENNDPQRSCARTAAICSWEVPNDAAKELRPGSLLGCEFDPHPERVLLGLWDRLDNLRRPSRLNDQSVSRSQGRDDTVSQCGRICELRHV